MLLTASKTKLTIQEHGTVFFFPNQRSSMLVETLHIPQLDTRDQFYGMSAWHRVLIHDIQ